MLDRRSEPAPHRKMFLHQNAQKATAHGNRCRRVLAASCQCGRSDTKPIRRLSLSSLPRVLAESQDDRCCECDTTVRALRTKSADDPGETTIGPVRRLQTCAADRSCC